MVDDRGGPRHTPISLPPSWIGRLRRESCFTSRENGPNLTDSIQAVGLHGDSGGIRQRYMEQVMDQLKRLLRWYDRAKRSLLVVFVMVTCIVGYTPFLGSVPGLFAAFLIAAILLYLDMFFSLSSSLLGDESRDARLLYGLTEVMPKIFAFVIAQARKNRSTTCEIMAVTGMHVFPYLKTTLLEEIRARDRTLNLSVDLFLMEDAFAEKLWHLDYETVNRASATVRAVEEFTRTHAADLRKANVSIECYLYTYTPAIHGFLMNREHLYMSHFHWGRQLEGAHNAYKYFRKEDAFGSEHIKCLVNWLERARSESGAGTGRHEEKR